MSDNTNIMEKEIAKAKTLEARQFLTFQLGSEEMGINILFVKEIIAFTSLTRIPLVPEYILGVLNVRGKVVPVIDLNARFFKKKSEVTLQSCIIIVEVKDQEGIENDIGMIVDSVEDVIQIDSKNMESTPGFGTRIKPEYVEGIGKIEERFIILLNIMNTMDVDELSRFEQRSVSKRDYMERIKRSATDKTESEKQVAAVEA